MSQSQTTTSGLIPKSHSLLAVNSLLDHASRAGTTLPASSSSQRDGVDEGDEEDLSLDLPPGENWMYLTTSSHLLASQASQSQHPVAPYASIHPLTASLSSRHEPPSLFPGDALPTKGSFLMIDVDGEYCAVKDIRIKPPTTADNKHYRFSICRRTHAFQLPAAWDHLSFTRRSCHLHHGDRLVLWETSDPHPSAVPSVSHVCCVWEKAYQATVETGDDEDIMVSQLDVEDAHMEHEEVLHTQQEQMLLTQGTNARSSSLTSPPLATQPESPKKQDVDEDEDDVTVDPREEKFIPYPPAAVATTAITTTTSTEKLLIHEKTESQHARDTSKAERTLQPDIRDCVAMASRLKDEGSQLIASTPQKKSRGYEGEKLRSPNLLDDSSVEGESQLRAAGDSQQIVKVPAGSAAVERAEPEPPRTPGSKRDSQETETESEASSPGLLNQKGGPSGNTSQGENRDAAGNDKKPPPDTGKTEPALKEWKTGDSNSAVSADKESKRCGDGDNEYDATRPSDRKRDAEEITANPLANREKCPLQNETNSQIKELERPMPGLGSPEAWDGSRQPRAQSPPVREYSHDKVAGSGVLSPRDKEDSSVHKSSDVDKRTLGLSAQGLALPETENTESKEDSAENKDNLTRIKESSGAKASPGASVTDSVKQESAVKDFGSQVGSSIPNKATNPEELLHSNVDASTSVPEVTVEQRENTIERPLTETASYVELKTNTEDKSTRDDSRGEDNTKEETLSDLNSAFVQRLPERKRRSSVLSEATQSGDGDGPADKSGVKYPRRRRVQKEIGEAGSTSKKSNVRSSASFPEHEGSPNPESVSKQEHKLSPTGNEASTAPLESKVDDQSHEVPCESQNAGQTKTEKTLDLPAEKTSPRLHVPEDDTVAGTQKPSKGRSRTSEPKPSKATDKPKDDGEADNTTLAGPGSCDVRRITRSSNRHKTTVLSKTGSSQVSPAKPVHDGKMPIGGAENQAVTNDGAAKGLKNGAQENLKQDNGTRKRKEHRAEGITPRTRRCKTTGNIPISKVKQKGTPRTTRRPKTELTVDGEAPSKAEEIYLLATGCDALKKKELACLKSLGMTPLDTDNPDEWGRVTHLLVDEKVNTKRTAKLMIAMCRARHVCTTAWLRKCLEEKQVVPLNSPVDPRVRKNPEPNRRITDESLERALELRSAGKYILSDFAISVCKRVAGDKAPSLDELRCMVENAGGVWLGEKVPDKKIEWKQTIVITSDPCNRAQKKSLETKGDDVEARTTSWLFDTLMLQRLDIGEGAAR